MTYLLVVFLVVLLVPLLAASWRVSLMGLAAQGALLGWMALRTSHTPSLTTGLVVMDTLVLRAIVAPRLLHRTLSKRNVASRNDVIPSNLFSWMLVAAVVFAAFRFADAVPLSGRPDGGLHMAVAVSALLLGLFVLSSQDGLFSQIVGLLRVENAIALFELDLHHHFVVHVQIALLVILFATILLCGHFLRAELAPPASTPAVDDEVTL